MTAFCAGWELTGGRPARASRMLLLAGAGVAMGLQSAAVRRLGQFSTTHLTSTLTGAATSDTVPALLPLVLLTPVTAVIAASWAVR